MYAPSCDGGVMTIFHLAFRVPALGFGGLLLGTCYLLYPAQVVPVPTTTKPNQVLASCPHGGSLDKVKLTDVNGNSSFELMCILPDTSQLTSLEKLYKPTVPVTP